MSKLKKIIPVVLVGIFAAVSLCACAGTGGSSSSSLAVEASAASSASSSASSSSSAAIETPVSNGNAIVVYYSASGNTEKVADEIASATGADTFAVIPKDVYTEEDLDWTEDDSRVNREHENESLREVALESTTVPNWDSYDTVYIGYPIWWGIAAWPIDGFVSANDFTGKTVIPFCTSTSSGIGESGELLADLAGTGDWQEGKRFESDASQSDVDEWISQLGQ